MKNAIRPRPTPRYTVQEGDRANPLEGFNDLQEAKDYVRGLAKVANGRWKVIDTRTGHVLLSQSRFV